MVGRELALAVIVELWPQRIARALELCGTPCYISAWGPVQAAAEQLERSYDGVPVRCWLSFKTHPLAALAGEWLRSGRGVEVVSEKELVTLLGLGCHVDQLLVNGVAKHAWLDRYPMPRLRMHFDSLDEVDALLTLAVEQRWRVGIRVHAPDECDARDVRFGGQFGLDEREAIAALRRLGDAGADVQSVHFHLGQGRHDIDAYARAVARAADICDAAGVVPHTLDCGGGLPSRHDPAAAPALEGIVAAMRLAEARFPRLREVWMEHGRFVSEESTVLAVTVLDVKEREEGRYVICDGGRTNQALAADQHVHPLLLIPQRTGDERLTTVCGPTCMTDDRLGRWLLPEIRVGDVIVWQRAGAYHLPWETRFSQGLCAIVWFGADERATVARPREQVEEWAHQ